MYMDISEQLQLLTQKIDELKVLLQVPKLQTRSAETQELFTALAKAQADIPIATHHSTNPYFQSTYADMAEIIRVSRPALTKNGLSVIQQLLDNDQGQVILHTILGHSSGQWIETQMKVIPPKNDVQTMGSYILVLRRHTYAALVGIATDDEDDDGEMAIAQTRELKAKGTALNAKYNPKENKLETITQDQLTELEYELSQYPDIADMILDGLKIQNFASMPKEKYSPAIRRVREIKQLRNGV